MKKFYLKWMGICIVSGAIQLTGNAQNLVENSNFEKDGGSFSSWGIASGTTLGTADTDHYAIIHGENGVLYQKIKGISVGKNYRCTIYFKNLKVKQTTGYGYALEKNVPLAIPTFTIGASNLKAFCEPVGAWTTLPADLAEQNVNKSFDVAIPDSVTAIYICMGTKGAVSDLQVDSVVFSEAKTTLVKNDVDLKNELFVYPVPASNEVTIGFNPKMTAGVTHAKLVIYDPQGRKISETPVERNMGSVTISVRHLKTGLYFVTVPEWKASARMVVSR